MQSIARFQNRMNVVSYDRITDSKKLHALIDAMILVEGRIDLHSVLSTIVKTACELSGAAYGALGVLDENYSSLSDFITFGVDKEVFRKIDRHPTGKGILGLLFRDTTPIRLSDLSTHPKSTGFPESHPIMKSFLGVPVIAGEEIFGNLYLCDKTNGEPFSEEDEDLVVALSQAAGISIDKARLYDKVQELGVIRDRERIARDLHDSVIQRLFGAGLNLQGLIPYLTDPDLKERIDQTVNELDHIIREIRDTIFAMRQSITHSPRSLKAQILDIINDVTSTKQINVETSLTGSIDKIQNPTARTNVLSVVRELLTNVAKHSNATLVKVSVSVNGDISVLIEDDGIGISDSEIGKGMGLMNAKERAENFGGSCEITKSQLGGASILWKIESLSQQLS